MAKEQLAVIEMVTNMILGKTGGISKDLSKKLSGKPGDSF